MATISDVARLAGVATSTVSHVLNGTRFVRAETARAVHDAVRAVGYTPNTLARALARSTTNTVGLAVSSTRNRYFADIINAIEEECAELGMMVLLANTRDSPEREREVVAALHERRVDGIILTPTGGATSDAIAYLLEKNVPAVMVDRLPDVPLDGVGVENRRAVAAMVDHLVGHGHRRIGFLAGQADFTTAQERVDGFASAMTGYGLATVPGLVAIGITDLEAARATAARMLGSDEPPSAMIGANNLTTIGIMLAARDLGLSVPQRLAVIGFDDFDWADAFEPQLTTVVQPCQAIGRAAAAMLKRRIVDPAGPPTTTRLDPVLIIRRSCGCPAPTVRHAEAKPRYKADGLSVDTVPPRM